MAPHTPSDLEPTLRGAKPGLSDSMSASSALLWWLGLQGRAGVHGGMGPVMCPLRWCPCGSMVGRLQGCWCARCWRASPLPGIAVHNQGITGGTALPSGCLMPHGVCPQEPTHLGPAGEAPRATSLTDPTPRLPDMAEWLLLMMSVEV